MNRKQKIIVSITGIFLVLMILVGLTYAYFLTKITGNTNEKSISVTTADLKLVYNDGSDGVIGGELIEPSDTVYTKTFTVKNEGNANIEYGVYLIDVINQFVRKEDIKYTLDCTTDGTIICNKVTNETTFPSGISQLVTNTIEPNKTHTYTFTFTYKDTGTDQSIDMNKELSAKIQIYGKQSNGEYFPYEENTIAYTIINNVKNSTLEGKSTFTPNLSATGMVDSGTTANDKILSTAEDDGGTTFYFRGNPIDNYLQFAGMCWRIVRIEGDGSVKLILASELSCSTSNLTESSGYATDGNRGTKGTILSDVIYGYDYFETNDNSMISKSNYFGNTTYNNYKIARPTLTEWLNRKMTEEEIEKLKSDIWYIANLTDAYYKSSTINKSENRIIGNASELLKENSNNVFDYNVGSRIEALKTPSYVSDMSGVEGESDINKIGMLTIDEVIYAGDSTEEAVSYINDNAKTSPWHTMSFAYKNGVPPAIFLYSANTSSIISYYYGPSTGLNIRPAVTLLSTTQIISGNGTKINPYVIK